MTAAEALTIVKLQGCTSEYPVVTDADCSSLISMYKICDSSGRLITDPDYEETYHIPAILQALWKLKAGRVATNYDMTSGDQTLNRSSMYLRCMDMAKELGKQCIGSAELAPRYNTRVVYPLENKDDV